VLWLVEPTVVVAVPVLENVEEVMVLTEAALYGRIGPNPGTILLVT